MYKELENTIIDKNNIKYLDFPDILDGHLFIKYDNGFITRDENFKYPVPQVITMRQARLHLLDIELLDDVEALVLLDRRWYIEWEYANEVLRTSPLIGAIKENLNLTDEQIDTMFIEASKL